MSATITERIAFDSPLAAATVLRNADRVDITEPTVVVNLAMTDAFTGGAQLAPLPPLSSTVLLGGAVTGEFIIAITLRDVDDPEQIARDLDWLDFYGPGGPVLLKSPQVTIGVVDIDRHAILHEVALDPNPQSFTVKANLWFSPSGTDCGIHNEHAFIEFHTQIAGYGRMQKFNEKDHGSIYEDQQLSPGSTNPIPFCVDADGVFTYPWHQYRADTNCIWLALEYHER